MRGLSWLLNLSIVTCFTFTMAMADEVGPSQVMRVDLDETISLALDTSEELKIKEGEIEKSQGVYREVRSRILPHATSETLWYNNMEYPLKAKSQYSDFAFDTGISGSQVLWSFGKFMYAVDSARKAADATVDNKEASRQDVIYTAKVSYYTCVLTRNALLISERSYANVLENQKLLEQRSYGGRSSKYEIIRMSADVSSRIPAVNEARTHFDAATETLRRIIDVDLDFNVELEGDFREHYDDFDYETLVTAMYTYEPSLQSLDKKIKSAEALVKSRYASFLPTVSAFASWNHRGGSNEDCIFSDGKLVNYSAAGLKVSAPLWEGGEKEAQLSQAKADREIAIVRKRQVGKNLLLELKKAFLEYEQYKNNLKANIDAVDLAEKSFKQSQEMFASGQISITDLNNAELLLTNQRLNKETTLYSINTTLARIEKLVTEKYDEREGNGKP